MTNMLVKRTIEQTIDSPSLGFRIGERCDELRQVHGVEKSRTKLARQMGMTRQHLDNIINERVVSLPETTLRKIESVLDCNFGVKFDD